MKLRYKIPHKVILRMVGTQFVAVCSCNQWSRNTSPRRYDRVAGIFPGMGLNAVEELIETSHRHATDHVMDQQGFKRRSAA